LSLIQAHVKDKMTRKNLIRLIWCGVMWACIAPAAAGSAAQTDTSDQRVSVTVKGVRLGEVLDKITRETGRVFMLDSAWRSHPVTVSFEDTPMNLALKRILGGLNSAIIYQRDASIKLIIIGNPPAGGVASGATPPRTSLRKPIDRGPIASPRGSIPSPPEAAAPMPQIEDSPPNPPEGKTEEGDE
jgi:hypothetical protein